MTAELAKVMTNSINANTTPASGDYGADLVGVDPDGVKWVIQAKNWHAAAGVHAVQEVIAAKVYYDADKAMVVGRNGLTAHAVTVALKAGVVLRTPAQMR